MDSDVYVKIIQDFIVLSRKMSGVPGFSKMEATAHMAEKIVDVLAEFFDHTIISKDRHGIKKPRSYDARLFFGGGGVFKK